MGSTLSLFGCQCHLVILGLDSAGKSTVLYRLKFGQYMTTIPTIGFNKERIRGTSGKSRNVWFDVWDVGGHDKVRSLWRSYIRSTDGIVFVVDSCDTDRLEEARVELLKTLRSSEASGVPMLVLANKQDQPGAYAVGDIEKALSLHELSGRYWHVLPVCAITGEGLEDALECIYQMALKRQKQLKQNKRKR